MIGGREAHATRAFFFIGGFGSASWAPLVPVLRERLAIGDDVLGLLLLCIGIGSLATMPLSGALSARLGCRRVLVAAGVLYAGVLLSVCLVNDFWIAVPIILIFGALMGCIDVVINVAAVIVEKGIGRRIMSGMHAFWSMGGFVGAGLYGVWVGILGLTAFQSTAIASLLILVLTAFFGRHLIPYGGGGGSLIAIPRGIVVFVGITAFIAFLSEGAVMDWSGVYLTTVRGMDLSLAGVGFSVFSGAMLLMRFLGDRACVLLTDGAADCHAHRYGGLRRQYHGLPRHSRRPCRDRLCLRIHKPHDRIRYARCTQPRSGLRRFLCVPQNGLTVG